jgi:hypothetical protein
MTSVREASIIAIILHADVPCGSQQLVASRLSAMTDCELAGLSEAASAGAIVFFNGKLSVKGESCLT